MSENKFTFIEDENLQKTSDGPSRASRELSDVQRQDTDGTAMSRSERRRMFQSEWEQSALPTPPEIPGWHTCWLSTTNQYDPIHKRMRMGYEPVKPTEVPGLDSYALKSGEFKGFISVNEMLLFKIPNEVYQELMAEMHYYRPLDEEDAIKASLTQNSFQDNNGKQLGQIEGEGFNELGQRKRTPNFV